MVRISLYKQYNGRGMALVKSRVRVHGWDSAIRTAYKFHGCMFYGHLSCPLTKDREFNPKTDTPLADLYATTQKNRAYLEDECRVKVVKTWEFEWPKSRKQNRLSGIILIKRIVPDSSHTQTKSDPHRPKL